MIGYIEWLSGCGSAGSSCLWDSSAHLINDFRACKHTDPWSVLFGSESTNGLLFAFSYDTKSQHAFWQCEVSLRNSHLFNVKLIFLPQASLFLPRINTAGAAPNTLWRRGSLCKVWTAVLCRCRALDSGWWTNSCCFLLSPNAAPPPVLLPCLIMTLSKSEFYFLLLWCQHPACHKIPSSTHVFFSWSSDGKFPISCLIWLFPSSLN